MIESIRDGFDYDAWANRLWAAALQSVSPNIVSPELLDRANSSGPWPDFFVGEPVVRAGDVFAHILFAQRIWLQRCGKKINLAGANADAWINALYDGWIDRIADGPLDEVIDYRNSMGQAGSRPFGEIARHVINHGTYHRGQLREIAEYLSLDEIPITDLITFFYER